MTRYPSLISLVNPRSSREMISLMAITIQEIVVEPCRAETNIVDLIVTHKYRSLLELRSNEVRITSGCEQEAFSASVTLL